MTYTKADFAALQADFSGADTARRAAAIPQLVDFLHEGTDVLRDVIEQQVPPSLWSPHLSSPGPLPPSLQTNESEPRRWFPLLRQLYRSHGLYGWDIGKCYLLRYEREGLTPLLLFELLECFSYFPVTRSLFASLLEQQAAEIAAQILDWLPSLDDSTLGVAISLLGVSVESRSRSLPALFAQTTPQRSKRMDHIIKAATEWLDPWSLELDQDERFACLRTLLARELGPELWPLLFTYLDAWERHERGTPHETASLAIDYADGHIDEALRQALQVSPETIYSLLTTTPRQTAKLARALTISLEDNRLHSLDDLHMLLSHPWLQAITSLTLTNAGDRASWLAGLQEGPRLPSLAQLAITDARLTWPDLAPLWQTPLFPPLKELILRRNRLSMASLPELQPGGFFTGLARLDLAHNQLDDRDAQLLATLPPMPQMHTLDLTGNQLTDRGLRRLLEQQFAPGCRLIVHLNPLREHDALSALASAKGYELQGLAGTSPRR